MSELIKIELPFAGFYESIHDDEIDRAVRWTIMPEDCDDPDLLPDPWADAMYRAGVDWSAIRTEYCRNYVEAFAEEFELTLVYDGMTSPREYNFSSDRIFAKIPRQQIDAIRAKVEADAGWADEVRERFTSRSGFFSFYSPDVKDSDWTAEVLDECQYKVMIRYWINMLHRDDPHNQHDWREREYFLIEDFEMTGWSSVMDAGNTIDKYVKEQAA